MLPIRFINLDRDAQRCAGMLAQGQAQGLNLERHPGVLWTALLGPEQDRHYDAALNHRQFHRPLVNGEKGCYASHISCWQWLLDSPHPALVVLEDDVRLGSEFKAAITAIEVLDEPWDHIKLIGRQAVGKREKLAGSKPLTEDLRLARYRRIPSFTAGYAVSRRGAAKLLASRLPFGRPVDDDLRHWWECQHLEVLGVQPDVLSLDESSLQSSIEPKGDTRSLGLRLRKAGYKLAYNLSNALHRLR